MVISLNCEFYGGKFEKKTIFDFWTLVVLEILLAHLFCLNSLLCQNTKTWIFTGFAKVIILNLLMTSTNLLKFGIGKQLSLFFLVFILILHY